MEDEFERLCDKHGLSKPYEGVMFDRMPRSYPTLSELLDMVEKKWPKHDVKLVTIIKRPRRNYECQVVWRDRYYPYNHNRDAFHHVGEGETKELAVLKALIQGDVDD